jgi:hypothetical protein
MAGLYGMASLIPLIRNSNIMIPAIRPAQTQWAIRQLSRRLPELHPVSGATQGRNVYYQNYAKANARPAQ